jgi:5-hydroxyisourate hydrolase
MVYSAAIFKWRQKSCGAARVFPVAKSVVFAGCVGWSAHSAPGTATPSLGRTQSVRDAAACTILAGIVHNYQGAYAPSSPLAQTRMGKLTTHVLNLATGAPAARMRVALHDLDVSPPRLLAETLTDEQGRCAQPLLADGALHIGRYSLTFHVAQYFREINFAIAEPPFLDTVVISFGVADAAQNYHIPLLTTPWSYSTYRGS